MSSLTAQIEYVVRVKLPSSAGYPSCPSGETDYERVYNDTIFAAKPEGFEVSWATKNLWPTDKDGKTWVLLYCTDQKKAVQYFNERMITFEKKVEEFRELSKKLSAI